MSARETALETKARKLRERVNPISIVPPSAFKLRLVDAYRAQESESRAAPQRESALKSPILGLAAAGVAAISLLAVPGIREELGSWSSSWRPSAIGPAGAPEAPFSREFGADIPNAGSVGEPIRAVPLGSTGTAQGSGWALSERPIGLVFTLRSAGEMPRSVLVELPEGLEFYSLRRPEVRRRRQLGIALAWATRDPALELPLALRATKPGIHRIRFRFLDAKENLLLEREASVEFRSTDGSPR